MLFLFVLQFYVCVKEFLPFSNLSNEEFIHNAKGKKINFTYVPEKQKSSKIKFFHKINADQKIVNMAAKQNTRIHAK